MKPFNPVHLQRAIALFHGSAIASAPAVGPDNRRHVHSYSKAPAPFALMRTWAKATIALLCIALFSLGLTACGGGSSSSSSASPSTAGSRIAVTGITLDKDTATLNVGGTTQLTPTVAPANATNASVTWTSDITTVATVSSSGLVTAVAVGTAKITATTVDGSFKATSTISVSPVVVPVTSITLDKTITVIAGYTKQLKPTFRPSTATNTNVTWKSDAESIATVSSSGAVKAIALGKATITATTIDGSVSATSTVTVASNGTASAPLPLSLKEASTLTVKDFAGNVETCKLADSEIDGSVIGSGTGPVATFNWPFGITSDGKNLYVADGSGPTIRQIASGVVTTLAGTPKISGNTDGAGNVALFQAPRGITTDGVNLYVAENAGHRIRKIVLASPYEVSTLAGTGKSGFLDGDKSVALFSSPNGITTDGTNLYVADSGNNRIRKVVIATGEVTTLAGSGDKAALDNTDPTKAAFNSPTGITTDGTNVYVTDKDGRTIRKIAIATGEVTTLAGSGVRAATDNTKDNTDPKKAAFYSPTGITTDGTNLYVVDQTNPGTSIRQIVISTGFVTTSKTWPTSGAAFGITTDGTSLFITHTTLCRITQLQ